MAMLFGSTKRFGIEVEAMPYPLAWGPPAGRIRLWVDSTPIGDFETVAVLGASEMVLEEFLNSRLDLYDRTLCEMDKRAVIEFLKGAVFPGDVDSDDADIMDELTSDAARYDKFLFCPNLGESFDGEILALINCGQKFRVIYEIKEKHAILERSFTESEITNPIHGFLSWYKPIKQGYIQTIEKQAH